MGRGVVTTRQLLKYGGRYCGGDSNSASACIGVTFFLFPRSFGAQNGRIFFARILDLLMNMGNQRPKIEPASYVTSGLAAASSPRRKQRGAAREAPRPGPRAAAALARRRGGRGRG
jgi:hypothetical protein